MPDRKDQYSSLSLPPQVLVRGQMITESPSDFLARNTRAKASITITVGGSIAENDDLKVTVTFPAYTVTKTIIAADGDTTALVAQKIAKALNDDDTLRSYGCFANVAASIVTFYWPGPVGNRITLSQNVAVGSGTLTLGNSGKMAGGSGPIIPFDSFSFVVPPSGQTIKCDAGRPMVVGDNVVAAMVAAKARIQ